MNLALTFNLVKLKMNEALKVSTVLPLGVHCKKIKIASLNSALISFDYPVV